METLRDMETLRAEQRHTQLLSKGTFKDHMFNAHPRSRVFFRSGCIALFLCSIGAGIWVPASNLEGFPGVFERLPHEPADRLASAHGVVRPNLIKDMTMGRNAFMEAI